MQRLLIPILLVASIAIVLGSVGEDSAAPPSEPAAGQTRSAYAIALVAEASEEPAANRKAEADPPEPPNTPLSDFPLSLPREFGPGPQVRGRILSESGQPLEGLRLRTTTWRPTGRGCFKPTYHLGWAEVDPDGGFVFHVDAAMLRDLPARKGRSPFSIEAEGHLGRRIELSPEEWSSLVSGRDLAGLEFRLRPAAALVVTVLDEGGRMCDGASVYHSKERTGGRWDYRGRTEDGVWRISKIDPSYEGYCSARFEDSISKWISVTGRLAAGTTTRLTLQLTRRDPVTLTVAILGYRDGLVMSLGPEKIPVGGPVTVVDTLTGPHLLTVSGDDPYIYESAPLEIPRGARNHAVEVDLRP